MFPPMKCLAQATAICRGAIRGLSGQSYGIMAHASRNLTGIGDVLKEGTLALESGLPFAAC